MSISAGLVGLPNVGKSTLFNALTKSSVPAENYPFCTINPHTACTAVPDPRLEILQKLYNSEKIIASTIEFVDIAGLVKGAASGEGLGNQFLSNIREVNVIIHVLRCFNDPNITSTQTNVDPLADFDIITTELALKDLESIGKRKDKINHLLKSAKNDPKASKELNQELVLLNEIQEALDNQKTEIAQKLLENATVETIPLLSSKKFLVVANLSEDEIQDFNYKSNPQYQRLIQKFGEDLVIPICVKLEYELSLLKNEERIEMENMLNITYNGLKLIIAKTYQHLGLITFFTCGPKEIHAWPIQKGITIRKAAGEIHSDLEKGFICAEIFSYNDLASYKSTLKIKEAGKLRTEGQDYIVQDGDIVLVRFNV